MASVKDFSVEEKLVNLYKLQRVDSSIDEIEILRGELPMEVKDLEDEIEGYNTRIAAVNAEISAIDNTILEKQNLQAESRELLKKYEKQQNTHENYVICLEILRMSFNRRHSCLYLISM